MSKPTDTSDGSTIEEQQLHQNLTLLSIAGPGSKATPANVDITKFTFRKPSSRALEHVLFQLYSIVVGEGVAQKAGSIGRQCSYSVICRSA